MEWLKEFFSSILHSTSNILAISRILWSCIASLTLNRAGGADVFSWWQRAVEQNRLESNSITALTETVVSLPLWIYCTSPFSFIFRSSSNLKGHSLRFYLQCSRVGKLPLSNGNDYSDFDLRSCFINFIFRYMSL